MKRIFFGMLMLCVLPLFQGCKVDYSFSGGSQGDAKTLSVAIFQNKATLVNPNLSRVFTEKIKDKFLRESKLTLVEQDGDFDLSGYINGYVVAPAAVQGNNQVQLNRLTVSVHVKFVNKTDPKQSFERDFSNYTDFDANQNLATVENSLIEDVTDKLVQDILNATLLNW